MYSKVLKPLSEKYILIAEKTYAEDNDTVSAMGGDVSAGTNPVGGDIVPVALDSNILGLYTPESPKEEQQTAVALKELETVFKNFETELQSWQDTHKDLGALDTVSRESVAQYIAKSILGLVKLD